MAGDKPLNEIYLFHLAKAARQFKKYSTDRLKRAGIDITSDQWILLKNISEREGINQRELADRCYKEPASVTRILDILEKKRWVERTSTPRNRRAYELYTTQAGKALVGRIVPLAIAIREEGAQGLSPEELEHLTRMLVRVYDNLQ